MRIVTPLEITARENTNYQLPVPTTNAEKPTVTVPVTTPPSITTKEPYYIFELVFQGQAHDIPIIMSIVNANDQQWVDVPTQSGSPPTVTYTETLMGASPPVATLGDFSGVQGYRTAYNASVVMSSAGSMVAAYTNQALHTDGFTAPWMPTETTLLERLCRTDGGDDRHGRPAGRRLDRHQWRRSAAT